MRGTGRARLIPGGSVLLIAAMLAGCSVAPRAPRRYLAITHPALNRVSFFDLDARRTVGVLPTQKLPHDMLRSDDGRKLFVVASGSQCVSVYDLADPATWREAATFMRGDSAVARPSDPPRASHPQVPMPAPRGDPAPRPVGIGARNPDPVQALPLAVVRHTLTDTLVPPRARARHAEVGAAGRPCFDCHDRSLGGKPFGPLFSSDHSEIYLVHLDHRNIAVLDAHSAALKRITPLDLPTRYSPVELWVAPDGGTGVVTCRDEIGTSRPGLILFMDLESGAVTRSIAAGIYPWHVLSEPDGRRAYINNFQSSRISVLDLERQAIVDSIVVENGPATMVFLPGRRALAVTCFYTDRVVIVDLATRRIERTIEVDSNPTSIEISTDGRLAWVLCGGESTLDLVDLDAGKVLERHPLLFGAYAFLHLGQDR